MAGLSRRSSDDVTFSDPRVAAVFETYPPEIRQALLDIRDHIFEVAANTEGVGEIEESLRWGEPAYLTTQTKSGSTIRLGWRTEHPDRFALHFICSTRLVERFRTAYPRVLSFDGNRSIMLERGVPLPLEELGECIRAALTYHQAKRKKH